jgi:hypothetical protein
VLAWSTESTVRGDPSARPPGAFYVCDCRISLYRIKAARKRAAPWPLAACGYTFGSPRGGGQHPLTTPGILEEPRQSDDVEDQGDETNRRPVILRRGRLGLLKTCASGGGAPAPGWPASVRDER